MYCALHFKPRVEVVDVTPRSCGNPVIDVVNPSYTKRSIPLLAPSQAISHFLATQTSVL